MLPLFAIVAALGAPLIMIFLLDEAPKFKYFYIFPVISIAGCGVGMLQQLIRVKQLSYAGDLGGVQDIILASIVICVFLLVITLILNFLALWGLVTGKGRKKKADSADAADPKEEKVPAAVEAPVKTKREEPVKVAKPAGETFRLKKKTEDPEGVPVPVPVPELEPEPEPEPEPEIPEEDAKPGYKIIEKDTGIEREPLVERDYQRQTGLLEIIGYFQDRKNFEGYQHMQEEKKHKKEEKKKGKQ
ncbi:MAG: hypothetical protein E7224_06875 [Clostridiales bacterium]|nr:hypothetical protein [Clostridiales bacterium]